MKKLIILLAFILSASTIKAQILDVPYRSDLNWICHVWCWAKSSQMAIVYYGNNINLCEVLEFARTLNPSRFGNDNCCDNPDSCCNSWFPSQIGDLLQHWSITSTYINYPLTINEVQNELQNNRPFLIHYDTHTVLGYGLNNNDIYIHDPGNGTLIVDYDDLYNGDDGARKWYYSRKLNISASNCLYIQDIPGLLNNTNSIYKATQEIKATCWITDDASIQFISGGDVILDCGFKISTGSTLSIESGVTLNCP